MSLTLTDTNSSKIASALIQARREAGTPAMGMVMTLVVVVPADDAEAALSAARSAAHEHPSRLLGVIIGDARGTSSVTAHIRAGAGEPGESALIELSGPVAKHPQSVVLPLLLPDSPVVVWWPVDPPDDPANDPLGKLATRRITDASRVTRAHARAMLAQCELYAPGNTDLAWTRITGWRALLASSLDQARSKVDAVTIAAERISPSAELLSAWLADRLKVEVSRTVSDGPGITQAVLHLRDGEIRIERTDGRLATLSVPGQPDRPVALRRREVPELLTEELRRLDPDDVYAATVKRMSTAVRKDSKKAKRSSKARS